MPTRPATIIRRLLGPARSAGADDTPDFDLLARYAATRDPIAFEQLARRHAGLVWHVCQNVLRHEQDAEDAFQATFLVLARRAAAVREAGSVGAFLHGVALRVSLRARRTATRRRAVPHEPAGRTPDPPADAAFRDLQVTLAEEVDRLPAKLRGPFVLCVLEGASRADTARALGLNAGTLSTRLAAARVRLRERLGRRGVLFAAALAAFHVMPTAPAAELARLAQTAVEAIGRPTATASSLAHWLTARPSWSKLVGVVATLGALSVAANLLSPARSQPGRTDPPPLAPPAKDVAVAEGVGDPLPAGAVRRLGAQRFRIAGRLGFALPTPDGKYALVQPEPAISGSPAHGLFLMDLESGLVVRTFEYGHRVLKPQDLQAIRPAAFSPDGSKLYGLALPRDAKPGDHDQLDYWGSFDMRQKRVLVVWDVATGRKTGEWSLPPGDGGESLLGVAVNLDGKRLYVWGAVRMRADVQRSMRGVPGVHVLDAETGTVVESWDRAGHFAGVTAEKELITFGRDAEVAAVDPKTGKAVRKFPLAGYIPSVAVSPDGKFVSAVAVEEQVGKRTSAVRVWECATGREIFRADTTPMRVGTKARLAFAADGAVLFLGTSSGEVLR